MWMWNFSPEFITTRYPRWTEKKTLIHLQSSFHVNSSCEVQKKPTSFCPRSLFSNTVPASFSLGDSESVPSALHICANPHPITEFTTKKLQTSKKCRSFQVLPISVKGQNFEQSSEWGESGRWEDLECYTVFHSCLIRNSPLNSDLAAVFLRTLD